MRVDDVAHAHVRSRGSAWQHRTSAHVRPQVRGARWSGVVRVDDVAGATLLNMLVVAVLLALAIVNVQDLIYLLTRPPHAPPHPPPLLPPPPLPPPPLPPSGLAVEGW